MATKLMDKVLKKDRDKDHEAEFPFVAIGFLTEKEYKDKKAPGVLVGRARTYREVMHAAQIKIDDGSGFHTIKVQLVPSKVGRSG